jgi:hypothetical protein
MWPTVSPAVESTLRRELVEREVENGIWYEAEEPKGVVLSGEVTPFMKTLQLLLAETPGLWMSTVVTPL